MDARKDREFHEGWSPAQTSSRGGAQLEKEGGAEQCRGWNAQSCCCFSQAAPKEGMHYENFTANLTPK